ncbi:MAG: hypothetical protein FVQ80_13930 [Planctomycetes bacterium]|nr:hypothetical protein [Planctomycetota bacterium]
MIRIWISQIDPELGDLISNMKATGERSMPATADAFRYAVTKILLPQWKSFASGTRLKGFPHQLKNPSGGYAASIKVRQFGPFDWEVYSEADIAKWLEERTKQVDFKKTHPFGKKSRVAYKKDENGNVRKVGYLIIPLRQRTPKARGNPMPELIYKMIQQKIKKEGFQKSTVQKAPEESGKFESNWKGELIPRATYSWGNRLQGLKVEFGNLEGMVVFDTGTHKATHSTYFTFRVISADSPQGSWIKPATPAMHITKAVWDASEEDIKNLIRLGLKRDLGL